MDPLPFDRQPGEGIEPFLGRCLPVAKENGIRRWLGCHASAWALLELQLPLIARAIFVRFGHDGRAGEALLEWLRSGGPSHLAQQLGLVRPSDWTGTADDAREWERIEPEGARQTGEFAGAIFAYGLARKKINSHTGAWEG